MASYVYLGQFLPELLCRYAFEVGGYFQGGNYQKKAIEDMLRVVLNYNLLMSNINNLIHFFSILTPAGISAV